MRQFIDYVKHNVPSSDVDRARELLSVLEDQEAIELQIEQGEEVWGGGLARSEGVSVMDSSRVFSRALA